MISVRTLRASIASVLLAAGAFSTVAHAGTLTVVSTDPARHALTAPLASRVSVTFNLAVNPATVNAGSFRVFGRWTGPLGGTYQLSNGNTTVTLVGNRPFLAGDMVHVMLSNALQAADGSPIRSAGYSFDFWTRARSATMSYVDIDTFSNRTTPEVNTRIYGAAAVDLNGDGHLDLTTVNEDSSDIRVFLNTGDPQDPYDAFLTPHPISFQASPNEPDDFNNDGNPDMCAAAAGPPSQVWILLGNGDGTFDSPGQAVPVPAFPHGITLLDADGDGDRDIATSNTGGPGAGNVSVLFNNGSGVFGAPTSFDGGGSGEYAIGAGDFTNDGIMDLVVGAINSQDMIIHRGNGNGTFTNIFTQDAGGDVWMLAVGDVNGDGNLDVSTANSGSNSGSILLGDGAGSLAPPMVTAAGAHAVATDLGDLDGDGDLDWVLSSFGGSVWRVYRNNGAGVMSFEEEFPAANNPSCAIILDFDNDRDLDLVMTDEIADLLTLEQNNNRAPLGDFNTDFDVDGADNTQFAGCFTGPAGSYLAPSCELGDFDLDGDIDCADRTEFVAAWTQPGEPPPFAACGEAIPTVGAWGALALLLLLGSAGTIVSARRGSSEPRP